MNIKAKIIGNQIWTSEDVALPQLKKILFEKNGIANIIIPVINDNKKWVEYDGPSCCKHITTLNTKKVYLYSRQTAEMIFQELRDNENGWRLPNIDDWVQLFKYLDEKNNYDFWNESIAESLRGTYGWPINGSNKIGFNAIPNFMRNEDGSFDNETCASWWVLNNARIGNIFEGIRLYPEDVIATFGTEKNTGLSIRLVRDISNPRPEEGLLYV